MEGQVYRCTWKKSKSQYILTVVDRPAISTKNPDFDLAREALYEEICKTIGDGEAQLEFDKRPPVTGKIAKWTTPDIRILGFNDIVHPVDKQQPGLFEGGYCKKCGAGIGNRTNIPIKVTEPPKGNLAGIWGIRPERTIYSDNFLQSLPIIDRNRFTFLEVDFVKRTKKKYCELIGKPDISFEIYKDPDVNKTDLFKCSECGKINYFYNAVDLQDIHYFIRKKSVPKKYKCFTIGINQISFLCMTNQTWSEFKVTKSSKGVVTLPVGLLEEDEVDQYANIPIW